MLKRFQNQVRYYSMRFYPEGKGERAGVMTDDILVALFSLYDFEPNLIKDDKAWNWLKVIFNGREYNNFNPLNLDPSRLEVVIFLFTKYREYRGFKGYSPEITMNIEKCSWRHWAGWLFEGEEIWGRHLRRGLKPHGWVYKYAQTPVNGAIWPK